jgi:hypothetical protein
VPAPDPPPDDPPPDEDAPPDDPPRRPPDDPLLDEADPPPDGAADALEPWLGADEPPEITVMPEPPPDDCAADPPPAGWPFVAGGTGTELSGVTTVVVVAVALPFLLAAFALGFFT